MVKIFWTAHYSHMAKSPYNAFEYKMQNKELFSQTDFI